MLKKEDIGHGLEKAAGVLPGVKSYQKRDSMREADKALRMELSGRLNRLFERVNGMMRAVAGRGAIGNLLPLEDLSKGLEKVSRLIEFASRGYSPLFSRRNIDEGALERIYEWDKDLRDMLGELEDAIQDLVALQDDEWIVGVPPVREMLSGMEMRLEEREALLKVQV